MEGQQLNPGEPGSNTSNPWLGGSTNPRRSSSPKKIIIPKSQIEGEVANFLAANRARKAAQEKIAAPNEEDQPEENLENNEENAEPEDAALTDEDSFFPEQNYEQPPKPEPQQTQLAPDQQIQTAAAMSSQRQSALMQLKTQEQKLDQEADQLIKELNGFKQTRTKRFLSFFKPNITFLVDNLVETLKKQATHGSFQARIASLTVALTAIASLIGTLKAFKLFTAFMDAAFVDRWSCLQMTMKTLETIVLPIIIILISPIWITFLGILFFIGKFPLFKGKLTNQIITMIEKLEKQQQFWQAQLMKLQQIVARQNQRKNLRNQEQQMMGGR